MLVCSSCKQIKDFSFFHLSTKTKRGYLHNCKECHNEYQRKVAKELKEKLTAEELKLRRRKKQLKHCYGVSLEQYQEMLEKQNYCCAICGINEKKTPKETLFVDHCHQTDKVRGLLCQHCNSALGYAKDSVSVLANCIKYLEDYK